MHTEDSYTGLEVRKHGATIQLHLFGPTKDGAWNYDWQDLKGQTWCGGHAYVGTREEAKAKAIHHWENRHEIQWENAGRPRR